MKKVNFLFVSMSMLMGLALAGCGSDDGNERAEEVPVAEATTAEESDGPTTDLLVAVGNSGCKKFQPEAATRSMRGKETIRYECTQDGYLLIKHVNAEFCCSADITVSAEVGRKVITAKEFAPPMTDCVCAYDVDMKIGPLHNQDYVVVFDCGYPVAFSFPLTFPSPKGEVEVVWEP